MPLLLNQLKLDRCPHCHVDHPMLHDNTGPRDSVPVEGTPRRTWKLYFCARCGGGVLAAAPAEGQAVIEIYPRPNQAEDSLPERVKYYLQQAIDTQHSASASIVMAASAVDAMLKARDYRDGSLYARIDRAAADRLITEDMAKWAHEIRLDANEQRHDDEDTPLPVTADAKRCIDFAAALGTLLFTLPSRVRRGIVEATMDSDATAPSTT